MGVAHAATTLRALLLRALASGLRNDAPDEALSMRQRYRLAELRCEEYLFVVMSRFINALEGQARRGLRGGGGGAGCGAPPRCAVRALPRAWAAAHPHPRPPMPPQTHPPRGAQGGSGALAAARSSIAWSHPLAMLLLGVRNIGLGGWMPGECMALENEVTAWQQDAAYDERDNALRCAARAARWVLLVAGRRPRASAQPAPAPQPPAPAHAAPG